MYINGTYIETCDWYSIPLRWFIALGFGLNTRNNDLWCGYCENEFKNKFVKSILHLKNIKIIKTCIFQKLIQIYLTSKNIFNRD